MPRVREIAVKTAEDCGQMSHISLSFSRVLEGRCQHTGEVLRGGKSLCRPVDSVEAIIDCATRSRLVMQGAEISRVQQPHLWTCLWWARRVFCDQSKYEKFDLWSQKAAKLIEPKRLVYSLRDLSKLTGYFTTDGGSRLRSFYFSKMSVQGFEICPFLRWRVKLQ